LHWGVNNFTTPINAYWTAGTTLYTDNKAVETPFEGTDTLRINLGPFNNSAQVVNEINFVIHYNDNTWENNSGKDYKIILNDSAQTPSTFIMDGALDTGAKVAAQIAGAKLYLDWNGSELYVATEAAKNQAKDVFIFISDNPSTLKAAPWAKQGSVGSWAAYIANESTNNYCSWYDQTGTTKISANNFLEGTINLRQELGTIPAKIYLAVGQFGTADNAALLSQIPASQNSDGNIDANEFYEFDFTFTGMREEINQFNSYSLEQNYPNPFNPETAIKFSLSANSFTSLKVYDVLGNEVAALVNEVMQAGVHVINFNGANLSSGVYFYQLKADGFLQNKKMILLK